MAGKQAKVLSTREVGQILTHIKSTRYPERNKVMLLLSIKAGLRAKEISNITWAMVTDASGQVGDMLRLPDSSSKGKSGRVIPLNTQLRQALVDLHKIVSPEPAHYVVTSERSVKMLPCTVTIWFGGVFKALRLDGCSSHSGRRTFVTNAAKKIIEAGGSLRDVQQLAGHASLQMTQSYIEGDCEAKRKVVNMI
jgi:integrase/recombinase XerC